MTLDETSNLVRIPTKMRDIEDYFSGEVGQPLYHYTGIDALIGMATTKSLWASNIYYLNDSKEITHACDILGNILKLRFESGEAQSPETEFLRQFQEWVSFLNTAMFNIFVFSLSEVRSLLSQWRSYTPHGKGVSVGFSPRQIKSLAQNAGFRIAKCVYDPSEQEVLLKSLIDKLLITFRQEFKNIDTSQEPPLKSYHPFLERFRGDILQVLAIIKHEAFKEEAEWRLISSPLPMYDTKSTVKYRQGSAMLVPYMDLPFGETKQIFDFVTLGPSSNKDLSMMSLSMFLINQQLCQRIDSCKIPYREL